MLEDDDLEKVAIVSIRRVNGEFSHGELSDAIEQGIRQYGLNNFELCTRQDPDSGEYELIYFAKH